jgi:hypothetical protein
MDGQGISDWSITHRISRYGINQQFHFEHLCEFVDEMQGNV